MGGAREFLSKKTALQRAKPMRLWGDCAWHRPENKRLRQHGFRAFGIGFLAQALPRSTHPTPHSPSCFEQRERVRVEAPQVREHQTQIVRAGAEPSAQRGTELVLFDEQGVHPLPAAGKLDAARRLIAEIAARYPA